MKRLWLVSRTDQAGYDDYDAMVVAADTEAEAKAFHPSGDADHTCVDGKWFRTFYGMPDRGIHPVFDWGRTENLKAECIGVAARSSGGVILSSFNGCMK